MMRKIDEYMMSQYDDDIVPVRAARNTRNRIRSSISLLSLSDSLCRLDPDSMQRPGMNTNSSSSEERVPLNMAASNSSDMEQDTVTSIRKENKATIRGRPFEFEVHDPPLSETQV